MLKELISFGPFIILITTLGVILWVAYWLLIKRHPDLGNERMFPRQLIMLGLTLLGILASVFFLPISDSLRNQLMGLIGIVISGIFAFSSTTVISNLMAGVLLRITKPFRIGDFIRIGDHFGRVSERGLFDTEIQTETRELIALPNTYCISNPVATIRSSGTIISASLSLGYDLDHRRIESLLMEAAQSCGLSEPFVHILELGNFSVTYRVSAFLEEPKRLISARSNLYACILDTLHSHDIEIMSPSFMNQRKISDNAKIIPTTIDVTTPKEPEASAENIAFDKAEQAEKLENDKLQVKQEIEKLEETLKQVTNEEEKKVKNEALEEMKGRLKSLEERPKPSESEKGNAEPGAALDGDSAALHPHQ
jgi:small conductance mechanosensitive channel